MKKADKKAELLKRLQNELDIRTQVEKEAVSLISNGECEKACALLNALDDSIVKDIERELDRLDKDEDGEKEEVIDIIVKISGDSMTSGKIKKLIGILRNETKGCPHVNIKLKIT